MFAVYKHEKPFFHEDFAIYMWDHHSLLDLSYRSRKYDECISYTSVHGELVMYICTT